MNPLLSIIVPTKNRAKYCRHVLHSLARIPSPDLEFVVSDSSDGPEMEDWIRARHDSRFKYFRTPSQWLMTDNFNASVARSTGEYLVIVGDDDGVLPEVYAAAKWARDNDVDALAFKASARYQWPDFRTRYYGSRHAARLYVDPSTGAVTPIDLEAALRNAVGSAGLSSNLLPKSYQNLLRRSCLDKAKADKGAYFKGASPDVYGGMVMARYVRRCLLVDFPVVFPGSSGGSNAGRSAQRTHKGRLQSDPHMQGFKEEWPKVIPAFFSVETVWGSAAWLATNDLNDRDLVRRFGFGRLYGACLLNHPEHCRETLDS